MSAYFIRFPITDVAFAIAPDVAAFTFNFVLVPLAYESAAVGPFEHPDAFFHTVFEGTFEARAIRPLFDTGAVLVIILPHPLVFDTSQNLD